MCIATGNGYQKYYYPEKKKKKNLLRDHPPPPPLDFLYGGVSETTAGTVSTTGLGHTLLDWHYDVEPPPAQEYSRADEGVSETYNLNYKANFYIEPKEHRTD